MEEKEMLEQTNETENVETQTTEENVDEGIELTDTAEDTETEESSEVEESKEKEEVKKTLKELLRENPEYQEEFNGMMKTRLDRKDREYQKEISKYRDTEEVLKTTVGGKDISEINSNLRDAYREQGVELPEPIKPGLSSREIEILAKADAAEIIEDGYDAMVSEANRLASKKYENLNEREKVIFNTLAEKLTEENNKRDLLKLGAKEELLKDADFIKFKKQFNSNVPMEDIYSLYQKNKPKPKVETPGSMKNIDKGMVKDRYTMEEISQLTDEQLDDPKIWEIVRKSMTS